MPAIALCPEQVRHPGVAKSHKRPGKIAIGRVNVKRVIIHDQSGRDMIGQIGTAGIQHGNHPFVQAINTASDSGKE